MASEIQISFLNGKTVYVLIRNSVGNIWNGSAFASYLTANYATYPISLTEQGSASSYYAGTFPPTIAPGVYNVVGKQQLGGSPAETDPTIGSETFQWNGSAAAPLADAATSGQVGQFNPARIARGTMITPFPFKLVSAADGRTPFVSGIVSGQIARDTGSFTALQSGAFTEIGLGWYNLQALTSGDLLANAVKLVFTATGISGGTAEQRDFGFILNRTSGQ